MFTLSAQNKNSFFKQLSSKQKKALFLFALLMLINVAFSVLYPQKAVATAATGYLRTDRMGSTAATGGTICITPQTVATEGKVLITFPGAGAQSATSYGVNGTASNWT